MLWFALVLAFLAVVLLAVAVREPETPARDSHPLPVTLRDVTALPRRYWLVVLVGMVFTLARFSEAFLVLRAESVGLSAGQVPLMMVVMSATYALGAYPAGIVADRMGGRALLAWGLAVLVVADLMLAAATAPAQVLAGAACWGVHMALTQGLFPKLVADVATDRLRGTAFGVFHVTTGVALLFASVIAGGLWSQAGPPATFYAGAAFVGLAMAGIVSHWSAPRRVAR